MNLYKFDLLKTLLFGLPKTIYVNFKFLKFRDAVKFPILISHRTWLSELKGTIIINAPIRTGMIKIGLGDVRIFDRHKQRSIIQIREGGNIVFNGSANIGHGSKICVSGDLIIGDNFTITAESSIICDKKVEIKDNCVFSWDVLIMDTDAHRIMDENGQITNPDKEIVIGNNVWIGCRVTVLKGSIIGDGNILATNSCVSKNLEGENQIIGGNPARILKENVTWDSSFANL